MEGILTVLGNKGVKTKFWLQTMSTILFKIFRIVKGLQLGAGSKVKLNVNLHIFDSYLTFLFEVSFF